MSDSDADGAARGGAAGAEAWGVVADDLLRAVNHALSNRLAALLSLTRVLDQSSVGGDPLLAVLQEEVERMEATTRLLRLLPRADGEQLEPVLLADSLAEVVALHRLRSELREVEVAPDDAGATMPVWVEPSALTRALLLALHATTRGAGGAPLSLAIFGDEEWAGVRIVAPGTAVGEIGAEALDAAGRIIARAEGEVVAEEVEGAARVELRLPTLLAVRRRGSRAEGA